MAEIRRKGVKDFPRLNNCRVNPEAYALLNRLAGRRALGAAVEDLCKFYRKNQALEGSGVYHRQR